MQGLDRGADEDLRLQCNDGDLCWKVFWGGGWGGFGRWEEDFGGLFGDWSPGGGPRGPVGPLRTACGKPKVTDNDAMLCDAMKLLMRFASAETKQVNRHKTAVHLMTVSLFSSLLFSSFAILPTTQSLLLAVSLGRSLSSVRTGRPRTKRPHLPRILAQAKRPPRPLSSHSPRNNLHSFPPGATQSTSLLHPNILPSSSSSFNTHSLTHIATLTPRLRWQSLFSSLKD